MCKGRSIQYKYQNVKKVASDFHFLMLIWKWPEVSVKINVLLGLHCALMITIRSKLHIKLFFNLFIPIVKKRLKNIIYLSSSEVEIFSHSEENNYIKWLPCQNSHQTSPPPNGKLQERRLSWEHSYSTSPPSLLLLRSRLQSWVEWDNLVCIEVSREWKYWINIKY